MNFLEDLADGWVVMTGRYARLLKNIAPFGCESSRILSHYCYFRISEPIAVSKNGDVGDGTVVARLYGETVGFQGPDIEKSHLARIPETNGMKAHRAP